jgi:hypothetical protein
MSNTFQINNGVVSVDSDSLFTVEKSVARCLNYHSTNMIDGIGGTYGLQTVKVSSIFTLPVRVTITGWVDDDLVINGIRIGNDPKPPAHQVNYSFILNEKSFEIECMDFWGMHSGYTLTICFDQI